MLTDEGVLVTGTDFIKYTTQKLNNIVQYVRKTINFFYLGNSAKYSLYLRIIFTIC